MKFAFLPALVFTAWSALAQTAFPEPNIPTVIQNTGQAVKAVWANGNEAELKFSRSKIITPSTDLLLSENLCSSHNGSKIKMVIPIRIDRIGWFWSKHADPAKIGKVVVFKVNAFMFDLLRTPVVSNGYKFSHPDLLFDLPPDELHFSDLNWLPGLEGDELKPFTVDTWTAENMVVNSQTGVNENRIVASAYGVHVQPTGKLSGIVDSIGSGFNLPTDSEFLLIGDVISWVWKNANGPCQISFKPDSAKAQSEVIEFISHLKDPFFPYVFGQDTLQETVEPQFFKEELWYADH